uniref:Transmembrane protein n=1 Tax=Globodera rostochiensis TaxID=31243 RepID=A0A914HNH0_GLORO
MSFRPFGVGVGIVLLGILWTLCLLSLGWMMAGVRKRGIQTVLVYPLIGAILTIVLMAWPRDACHNDQKLHNGNDSDLLARPGQDDRDEVQEEIDWLAIPRAVFAICLLFLALFAIARHLRTALFTSAPLPPTARKWHNR